MSDALVSSLNFATSKTYVALGIPIIIGGVLGGILNCIVFLSLQTYRQSSSAFYLTVTSMVNIGQLLTGFTSRVLVNIVDTNWMEISTPYCKIRYFIFQSCSVISPTCLCLAIIDQFLATSNHPQWRRWSNLKTAHSLTALFLLFWLLTEIPVLLYYNVSISPTTGLATCGITHVIYEKYYNTFQIPALMWVIPISITIVFGLLAYYNVKQLAHRTVPLVRRRHEVQLTVMILVQVIFNFFAISPTIILRTIASNTTLANDLIIAARIRLIIAIFTCIYQCNFACPFYIYICVSERFRKQLRYVLFDFHSDRWRRLARNRVLPEICVIQSDETHFVTVQNIQLE